MRVGVQLVGLEPKTGDAILAHLNEDWNPDLVVVSREIPPGGELDGLVIVGDGRGAPTAEALIVDTVEVVPGVEGYPVEEVLFQIDAKLGRLTKSHLARQSATSFLKREAKVTRRELIFGARSGFQRYSNLPIVLEDACEAKHGCRKCVDVCPANALSQSGNSISISDADCSRCGLCVASCPVGAVQMPELSEAAVLGMLALIDKSAAPKKTLVLTCNERAVSRRPWMVVEKVTSVGLVGPRLLANAAASSLGCVAVACPDGKCTGRASAKAAVNAISGSFAGGPSPLPITFVDGRENAERLVELHESSKPRTPLAQGKGDKWEDYVAVLMSLSGGESPASGLGLTELAVSDSCTLCGACVQACPHGAFRMDRSSLNFDGSLCTGCGLCVKTCPEHSITIRAASGTLSKALKSEKVYEDQVATCSRCGKPIGTVKFVARVSSLLGPDNSFASLCPSCKQQPILDRIKEGMKRV